MGITPPLSWREVSKSDFDEYLKHCPDYYNDGWANGDRYRFRHNGKDFAFASLPDHEVLVDPALLVPHPKEALNAGA